MKKISYISMLSLPFVLAGCSSPATLSDGTILSDNPAVAQLQVLDSKDKRDQNAVAKKEAFAVSGVKISCVGNCDGLNIWLPDEEAIASISKSFHETNRYDASVAKTEAWTGAISDFLGKGLIGYGIFEAGKTLREGYDNAGDNNTIGGDGVIAGGDGSFDASTSVGDFSGSDSGQLNGTMNVGQEAGAVGTVKVDVDNEGRINSPDDDSLDDSNNDNSNQNNQQDQNNADDQPDI